jgi:glycosyltransferase involved in cell wall biosynthesis
MVNPLVSVIIPTYNRQKLVFRALESVFKQTYRPLEIIVADDCSTDCSVEYLSTGAFPIPVEVLALPSNQGPSAARNAALERATGKYVAFLDSDDYWLSEKVERQVAFLEGHSNPESLLVYSQIYILRKYEMLIRPRKAKHTSERLDEYMFNNGGQFSISSVILSTSLARNGGFKAHMRLHEDWDFYLRLDRSAVEFAMIPEPLCVYEDITHIGRASSPQPALSLAFLEKWKGELSPSAYLGLRAKISPQLRAQRPLRALRFILAAYAGGAISLGGALALIGRLLHPGLREVAYLVRGSATRICGTAMGSAKALWIRRVSQARGPLWSERPPYVG